MPEVSESFARELARRPFKLDYNRVWRVYKGGYFIDVLRGAPNPVDSQFPEDWAASDTQAMNEGREDIVEGLSEVMLPDGEKVLLRDLLRAAPEDYLGAEHVSRFGSKLGLLVKLLDSCERLQVQAHPSREFSRRYLNDPFGKTESWIILNTRRIGGNDPYIFMGFRERIDKAAMDDLVTRQDSAGMEQILNKVQVEPGDIYIINSGMPHAIGPGVFMVEVQEPTDWVVSAEFQVGSECFSEKAAFMGLEKDLALDIFDYDGPLGMDAVTAATLKRRPGRISAETVLVGPEDTDCFSAYQLTVMGDMPDPHCGQAYSGIVVEGQGEIVMGTESLALRCGDSFFVPASSRHEGYRAAGGMQIIASMPPQPSA